MPFDEKLALTMIDRKNVHQCGPSDFIGNGEAFHGWPLVTYDGCVQIPSQAH